MKVEITIPSRVYGRQKTDKKNWVYFIDEKFEIDVPEIEIQNNKTRNVFCFQNNEKFYDHFRVDNRYQISQLFPCYLPNLNLISLLQTEHNYDNAVLKKNTKKEIIFYDRNIEFAEIIDDNLEKIKEQMKKWRHHIVFDTKTKQFFSEVSPEERIIENRIGYGSCKISFKSEILHVAKNFDDNFYKLNLNKWAFIIAKKFIESKALNFPEHIYQEKLFDIMDKTYKRILDGNCVDSLMLKHHNLAFPDENQLVVAGVDFEDLFIEYLDFRNEILLGKNKRNIAFEIEKFSSYSNNYLDVDGIIKTEFYLKNKNKIDFNNKEISILNIV